MTAIDGVAIELEQVRQRCTARINSLKQVLEGAYEDGRRRDDPSDEMAALTLRDVYDECFLLLFRLAADGADPLWAFQSFEQYVAQQLYTRVLRAENARELENEERRQLGAYARVLKLVRNTYQD
jgi:hypothetical protein